MTRLSASAPARNKALWQRVFRPARQGSVARYLTWTLLQSALFWLLFLAVIPLLLHRLELYWGLPVFDLPTPSWAPWLLFAVAGTLNLACGATMARRGRGTPLPSAAPRRLVVHGPYRHVRNPMAIAGLTQGASVAALLGSWLTVAYVLCGALLWNYTARRLEEQDLEDRFGDAFVHYRQQVRCWLPRWTPYVAPGEGEG